MSSQATLITSSMTSKRPRTATCVSHPVLRAGSSLEGMKGSAAVEDKSCHRGPPFPCKALDSVGWALNTVPERSEGSLSGGSGQERGCPHHSLVSRGSPTIQVGFLEEALTEQGREGRRPPGRMACAKTGKHA